MKLVSIFCLAVMTSNAAGQIQGATVVSVNNVDCVGEWMGIGGCSVTCGNGQQQQIYQISEEAENGGDKCQEEAGARRTVACTLDMCPAGTGGGGSASTSGSGSGSGSTSTFVAFTALLAVNYATDGAPDVVSGQTLVFNHVLTNEGGAYNSSSGEFTCPRDGTYMFFVHLENSRTSTEVFLKKDGVTLIRVAAWPNDDYHAGSNSVITSCSKDQKIYVAGGVGKLACCRTNSFSGYSLKIN